MANGGYSVHLIAAARPNFMKVAPLYHALKAQDAVTPVIVHTGQHYDVNMSDAFFEDLGMPAPDLHLGIGGGSHAEQTGQVMMAYEKVLYEMRPDMVVVVGDVNSTVACALAAAKVNFAQRSGATSCRHDRPLIAHLEAGLRSRDRAMPEEVNRLVTDVISDILWTPSPDGDENLLQEGIDPAKIVRVGNIMIDSFEMLRSKIESQAVYRELGLEKNSYGVVTLHRPSNVDDPAVLARLCEVLERVAQKIKLVFPVHPRTKKNLEGQGLWARLDTNSNICLLPPANYIRFMNLVLNSRFALTDSGGIQEETTYLGIPCFTLRPNTERPITVTQGTNRLCKLDEAEGYVDALLSKDTHIGTVPDLWDGHTAERVVASILAQLGSRGGGRPG